MQYWRQGRTAGADSCKGKQDQQRFVHGALVAALPDAHAVECMEDLVMGHDQYCGLFGRTPLIRRS
jgi:hypothetical protein